MFCWPSRRTGERDGTDPASSSSAGITYHPAIPPPHRASVAQLKEKGNELFRAGNHALAVVEYTRALSYFRTPERQSTGLGDDRGEGEGDGEAFREGVHLLSLLLSNRSAAYAQGQEFRKALSDAEQLVHWRPDWMKSHFRRGEALHGLERLEEAHDAYQAAQQREPSAAIAERLRKLDILLHDRALNLEIHQLQPGRDLCHKSAFAPINNLIYDYALQLQNYIYLIANRASRECVVVDCCWDVEGVLAQVRARGLRLVGALVTHHHIDHVGGIPPPPFDAFNIRVDGLVKLLRKLPHIQAYAHELEIPLIVGTNPELPLTQVVPLRDGDVIPLGNNSETGVRIQALHTPGHTPGSTCYLVNHCRLFSGDTLFVGSCGRVDFPESSASAMFASLRKLQCLAPSTVVYAGHAYGGEYTTIGDERASGLLACTEEREFTRLMGVEKDVYAADAAS